MYENGKNGYQEFHHSGTLIGVKTIEKLSSGQPKGGRSRLIWVLFAVFY